MERLERWNSLRFYSEAYGGQIDSKNEALRPENTLPWDRITELAGT
jgi:hypothetical protein